MITIYNMHKDTSSECFRLCLLLFYLQVLLIVHFVCLFYVIYNYLLEADGAGRGVCAYYTLLLQMRSVCVCMGGWG